MTSYYCPKCKEGKTTYQYANSYNSTKFCCDCGTALEKTNIATDTNRDEISRIIDVLNNVWKE